MRYTESSNKFVTTLMNVQDGLKVTQPIPDTCSICQKINYVEIRKQKQCYIKCWKCPPRSAIHAFTLFLRFDATQ
jgi:hypothetical protein